MNRRRARPRLELAAACSAALCAACALEPSNLPLETGARAQAAGGRASGDPTSEMTDPVAAASERPDALIAPAGALGLKPLDRIPAEPLFDDLPVPGFPDAVVAVPSDPDARRPVVVVLHGLGDRPEPHCEAWRTITNAYAFVLCPRGSYDAARSRPGHVRYTHPGGAVLRAHVAAALTALVDRFGDRVDATRPLLVGFSLGATEAAVLAQDDAQQYPRVALVEGGLDVWFEPNVGRFATGGGRRVLFGCGSAWCTPSARAAGARIDGDGVGARIVYADVGHRDAPALQAGLRAELDWLAEGDPRWPSARENAEPEGELAEARR